VPGAIQRAANGLAATRAALRAAAVYSGSAPGRLVRCVMGEVLSLSQPSGRSRTSIGRISSWPQQAPRVPVTLHIYDVDSAFAQGINRIFSALGTGVFHVALEVHGQEWSYGFSPEDETGIFSNLPGCWSMGAHRDILPLGETAVSFREFNKLMDTLQYQWRGPDYCLLGRNCCQFCDELGQHLGLAPLPPWVMSLANAGSMLKKSYQKEANYSLSEIFDFLRDMAKKDAEGVTFMARFDRRMVVLV